MATVYGPTPEGWYGKPLDVILDELDSDWQGILGTSAGTEPDGTIPLESLAGQQKVVLADGYAAIWDLLQAVISAFDPNQASGAQLDALCSLTATTREPQTFSLVTETCTGTPLTVLRVGRVVTVTDTGSRFDSLAAINPADANYPSSTIAALSAWAPTTGYTAGQRVTNGGNAYQCKTAGTSAGSGGPSGTGSSIGDNTVVWEFLGVGTGAVDVNFQAEQAGPVGALAGHLTNIATPVAGWSSATNLADAVPGALQQSDALLRASREQELAGQGGSTADAILAKVLKVNAGSADPKHQPPTAAKVFFNDTDATNSDGMPPHSVEVLVVGGTDADIALAVWEAVAAGTQTTGNQTSTVTDSEGNAQTVKWSRPVNVPIYVTATVYYDPSQWVANSSALVVQAALSALLTYGESFPVGRSVRAVPLSSAIVDGPSATDANGNAVVPAPAGSLPAPGILDVTPLYIGTSPSPASSSPVSIGSRQIARFQSANCVLTAVSETP